MKNHKLTPLKLDLMGTTQKRFMANLDVNKFIDKTLHEAKIKAK